MNSLQVCVCIACPLERRERAVVSGRGGPDRIGYLAVLFIFLGPDSRTYRRCGGPQKWAALALPDVLTARAGDRLRGLFFLQLLPANWTFSLPHINTCLFSRTRIEPVNKGSLVGRSLPVCSSQHTN